MTRVVVLGGGFAGMETIRCLERGLRAGDDYVLDGPRPSNDVEILLVSDQNYLLFTPLVSPLSERGAA